MSFIDDLKPTKLKARNYKCFGPDAAGFDTLRPVNLIVGRNNSGKSALLDLVKLACNHIGVDPALQHRGAPTQLLVSRPLTAEDLRPSFPDSMSGGNIGGNFWMFGKKFIGSEMTVEVSQGNKRSFVSVQSSRDYKPGERQFNEVGSRLVSAFHGKNYYRLVADRDIVPETATDKPNITGVGAGFTNTVRQYLMRSNLPEQLINTDLLGALNEVFSPDVWFDDIEVQEHGDGKWEVYLRESDKGRVPLSHSGSGLKTVLLVLGYLILLPAITKQSLSTFVFAFEELENNLHPALQRRLIKYLRDAAVANNFVIFLTSHSSALIDLLSNDEVAQIVHVTHDGKVAAVRHVTAYCHNRGILDDLDVRASDLLQSNGIVWVEGPSDRMYFNRWVDLATKGRLSEGAHYQCVFYGGRLLAHLSGEAPFDLAGHDDLVKIFAVNRNAIVLIDSDKTYRACPINETKKRIVAEVEKLQGLAWVTKGREVENYLPTDALEQAFPAIASPRDEYADITGILEQYDGGEFKRFAKSKVLLAGRMLPYITEDGLRSTLDLRVRLSEVCTRIGRWNGIEFGPIPTG